MKDIRKLLSENSKAILPDDDVKENIKRELGIRETDASLVYAHGGEGATRPDNKKKIAAVCAAALALVLALCLILPNLFKGKSLPGITDGNKFLQITDADSFYAYGAASVGLLLTSGQSNPAQAPAAKALSVRPLSSGAGSSGAGNPETDQTNTINRYLALVESLLSDGAISGENIAGENGYRYGMTVQYTDLLGSPASYTMYYDKHFLYGETEDDEKEENYSITGILCAGTAEYPVEGRYQTETEEGESENELYFRAYTSEDKASYIKVEQEYESEAGASEVETEYVYSVYANGSLAERTAVEYESEDGELELLMRITGSGKNDTLRFRNETEKGERVLRVDGSVNGNRVRFRVYVREGKYHYVFEDGSSSDFDRFDDDDDHDGHYDRFDDDDRDDPFDD